jgi:hypothetical protein
MYKQLYRSKFSSFSYFSSNFFLGLGLSIKDKRWTKWGVRSLCQICAPLLGRRSCHVMSALTYPTKSERARIEQSARGSNRVPAVRTERPQTECHRIREYVYVEIRENVHNTLSTAAPQLNTSIVKRIWRNTKMHNTYHFLCIIFFLFFFFQFSDVASLASIPKRDLVLKWQHGFRICLNSFLKN